MALFKWWRLLLKSGTPGPEQVQYLWQGTISQTGTAAPVLTETTNSGLVMTPTRQSAGIYLLTSNQFLVNIPTAYLAASTANSGAAFGEDDHIEIDMYTLLSVAADGLLDNRPLAIVATKP